MNDDKDNSGGGAPPQDVASPIIYSRSLMVGESSMIDRNGSQEDISIGQGGNSQNVRFSDSGSPTTANDVRSPLNTSEVSRSQAYHAAQRSRERSEEEMLAHPVADAGLNTFGCVFIEVWVMSDDGRKLTRPVGGHWMVSVHTILLMLLQFILYVSKLISLRYRKRTLRSHKVYPMKNLLIRLGNWIEKREIVPPVLDWLVRWQKRLFREIVVYTGDKLRACWMIPLCKR